ncbi:hypothetical protein [Streptomyces bauhiniae]|uniref:Uncharacterized protein n=1 Tax=Streptomyces bauhiniae TaxID=2340725 RepID=A0A7K3QK61_9ACTN|nr:hypothetical protein [Streptomyces bauhiniae]NEB90265.1 hypothetical protein [Streptomyces bauhiniae]
MSARRIPLNLYGLPFGLAGVWLTAADEQDASAVVGEVLAGLSAIAWVVVSVCYVRYATEDGAPLSSPRHRVTASTRRNAATGPVPVGTRHAPTGSIILPPPAKARPRRWCTLNRGWPRQPAPWPGSRSKA